MIPFSLLAKFCVKIKCYCAENASRILGISVKSGSLDTLTAIIKNATERGIGILSTQVCEPNKSKQVMIYA